MSFEEVSCQSGIKGVSPMVAMLAVRRDFDDLKNAPLLLCRPEYRSTVRSPAPWARRRSCSKGFTLVEVLATIMLMAIALPVVNKACVVAASTGNEARHRTEASSLARSKLSELIAGYTWNGNGAMNGDFGPDRPGYTWDAKAASWANDTQAVGMFQIDLTIRWQTGHGEESLTVSSLAYVRPQPSS